MSHIPTGYGLRGEDTVSCRQSGRIREVNKIVDNAFIQVVTAGRALRSSFVSATPH